MMLWRAQYARRVATYALVLAVALLPRLQASAARHAPHSTATPRWLVVNAKAHAVKLTLVAGYNNALGGFNFDGYGNGAMVISVPAGYRVGVTFTNKGSLPHSAVFTPYAKRNSTSGFPPAFRGSSTTHPTDGIQPGQTQRFSFGATKVGTYALVCGVPGHEIQGMW